MTYPRTPPALVRLQDRGGRRACMRRCGRQKAACNFGKIACPARCFRLYCIQVQEGLFGSGETSLKVSGVRDQI